MSVPMAAVPRALWLAALVVLALAIPRRAFAWVDMHVSRDDIRVSVDADGSARVEHKVLLLVSGGPLKEMTIRGVDPDAALEDGAYVVLEKDDKAGSVEHAVPLTVNRVAHDDAAPARTDFEVEIDGARGISRGRFVAVIRYKTDLFARGLLKIEGATARLDWTGPAWDDGLETTRAWFQFRSARQEPKTIEAQPGDEDDDGRAAPGTFLSTFSRKPDQDLLEIVRPYASKGERVVWSMQLDAHAVEDAKKAGSKIPAESATPPPRADRSSPLRLVSDARETFFLLGALSLFVLVAALVGAHALEVRQRAAKRDQKARPLIPLPVAARAIFAGLLFVAGLWLELHQPTSLPGALTVATAALLIWHRPAIAKPAPRGPGSWLCVRIEEAFAAARPRARGVFEASSLPGALVLVLIVGGFVAAGWVVAQRSVYHGVLVALDVVPLLALFASGREASFVPDPAVDAIPLLKNVVRRVEKRSPHGVRVIPRVRMPKGSPDPDEIRVVFLPQTPARGLRAIEVAVAYGAGPSGYFALPEVLLRFDEGTACDALVQTLEPFGRAQRGRRADERVVAFAPKFPTPATTAELVLAMLERTRRRLDPVVA